MNASNAAIAFSSAPPSLDHLEIVRHAVEVAAVAAFADWSLSLDAIGRCEGPLETTDLLMACIGFEGPAIRGRIVLATSIDVMRTITPPGVESSVELHQDHLEELANMTAGRFKARLLIREVPIVLGTPVDAVRDACVGGCTGSGLWIALASDVGPVFARFDVALDPEIRFSDEPNPALAPIVEGEALFF